jgi:hypothetical protein
VAKGADIVAGGCPAHTIYIWPSRELIARSWDWPEAWHAAFEQAAGQLAGLIATRVLGGLPLTREPAARQLRAGWVSFRVRCSGTRIYIAILDFEGPHAPGPDGGTRRQPYPVGGLVLGLRGSGKDFTIVTFYGPLPPVPAENIRGSWRSTMLVNVEENIICNCLSPRHPMASITSIPTILGTAAPDGARQIHSQHHDLTSKPELAGREGPNRPYIYFTLKEPRPILENRYGRSMTRGSASFGNLDLDSRALLQLASREAPFGSWLDRGRPASGGAAGMQLH